MAKRLLAIILAAVMVFAFAACANTDTTTDAEGGETSGMAPIAKEDLKVGFVYIGDEAPELCPVCKVPAWKFEKIEGRA